MTPAALHQLLVEVRDGVLPVEVATDRVKGMMGGDLGFAHLDLHRQVRTGHPEVVFGQGKTPEQVCAILERLHEHGQDAIVTRVEAEKARHVQEALPSVRWYPLPRILAWRAQTQPDPAPHGRIGVVSAGTSDLPVAEEAALVAELFGNRVDRHWDVGVAGIHRLLGRLDALREARVLIVVAGMEGALASVVAGLVDKPVIAVPTSVGYGANLGGIAALLTMLNSCASGVSVVNIDNGFGAAMQASLINGLDRPAQAP